MGKSRKKAAAKKPVVESDDDDDVEMDGVDLEGDRVEEGAPEDDILEAKATDDAEDADDSALAAADKEETEEARKELSLIKEAAKKAAPESGGAQSKFEYLMQQSDVFAQFLAGSVASDNKKKKKKSGKKGGRSRMSEADEDAQLLKSAQSKRHVIRLDKQPSCLASHCKMHPYQLEGLNWMIKLHDHGINGILADEMGLGKTLQTISMLAYLRESRGVKGPHLVIVPKSVLGNWMRELKKWCPAIRAVRMGGSKAERKVFLDNHYPKDLASKKRFPFDVLVTSYEGVNKEKGKLSRIQWKYLIIDEAHRIKRPTSALSRTVRLMETDFRLLITGTPLQNDLQELWALLNFIMPEVFGDSEYFDQWFSLESEDKKDNVVSRLHSVLRPFMLRRIKKDVATTLPPKTETKLYIGLTDMQQKWYVSCLKKDAHELNKLGGPDRNRLLNVLMQLRKVCNHPYLFDGAEQQPYIDGPHIWENSGKMQLLHKFLPKLQANGSRVLIFCQMTRVLDILEDYCRYVGFEYCRIDGNTDGEKRDSQVDEFNEEGSSKFIFLLSTRAGGLGINLATADTVVLFDSDWNPQVDLQAMDRAHRIGQTKPVQVFRFVTERTVEEKIIERADRKLFLDAAVIQQGRLAEQNSSLEKGELMRMVQFGADQILSATGGTYSDQDIDALIAKGKERTTEIQAKLEVDAKHNLANFSLLSADDGGTDTFSFGGKNYRGADKAQPVGNFINLPQRQRKRNYDLSANENSGKVDAPAKKKRKGPALYDFQLFDMDKLNVILRKERALATKKDEEEVAIAKLRQEAVDAPTFGSGVAPGRSKEELLQTAESKEKNLVKFALSEAERERKKSLLAEGFPDWSRKDFRAFCTSLELHGRYDFPSIYEDVKNETGKEKREIQRYFVAFWTHYQRILEWGKVIDRIEKGEKKIVRLRLIRDAIQEKVERHLEETFGPYYESQLSNKKTADKRILTLPEMIQYSWSKMKIQYGNFTKGRGYEEQEDAFLLCMMYRHGYGNAERIRMEVRRAWQFRFDWFFKSRSTQEIQKRCDFLVKIVEREMEELRKKESKENAPAPTVGPTLPSTPVAK